MRRALAAATLAACFILCLAAATAAQGPTAATLPETPPAPAIPEPPAGSTPPQNIDTPPAFVQRAGAKHESARQDVTFATRPAPAIFRGIAFGAGLDPAKQGLEPVTKPVPLPGTFFRPDELLRLGQAEIRSVAYYFPKGQFSGVGIVFEGQDNFFLIKDHLIDLYGMGRQMGERFGWTWSNFFIDLRMRGTQGELRYTHQP